MWTPENTRPSTEEAGWGIESFELSPDGGMLAYVANEDGASALHLADAATGAEKPAPKLQPGVIGGLKWHPNGRDLGFNFVHANSPADAYSLDTATGEVTRWTESETGGLDAANFLEPEIVRVKSFDGRTISGFVYRPDPAKFRGPRPAIISIHGGPEGQSRPSFLGRSNYFLNELGIALVLPNVRGSTGYGKTFRHARQRLEARGLGEGHRRRHRLDRAAGPNSIRPAWWSPAAATAAT